MPRLSCSSVTPTESPSRCKTARIAGEPVAAPPWIDPAIESALLLGMLGTLHGMVNGFVGLEPGDLQPGPLVQSLGTALRSSFVGFGIALVGVWLRETPQSAVTP